jgi:pimeloyl-ACP methyl ester carboxylesterase
MRLIGWRGSLKLAAAGMLDRLASVVGREHRIPIVAPPGTVGAMTAPEAEPGYSAMYPEGFDWDNSTPARIALSYGLYSPGRDSAKIACPLLVVVGTRDQTTPAGPARAAARRAPKGEVVSFSCGHFDVYVGEWFERAVAAEVEFLRRCLAAEPARAPRPA